ncbi:MAG: BrnA antitoxin family protein [Acaryochloris sp. RU_4_1]|nr:BrnA antitoxin family protein [Acaryochloris sp. RU_4_1]NJN38331.1 BrnA antitoxin family protein [Acaryochloridaceae cyanobacterium CSU_3_4]NJR53594.1 BrnA antitoxin family protein [Acaryochloris sp. CRU_2_0]
MPIIHSVPTTEMQVTSIRLERELKDKLKALSGHQGYQALIREILWNYVQQKSGEFSSTVKSSQISVCFPATAQTEVHCALTGQLIHSQEPMQLGLTVEGVLIPLSLASLSP